MNYNLLEEEWIPVLMRDGKYRRVGIREALTHAGRIRQIAASNPMDNVAVLRLLLAVLQWCKPNPTQDELEPLRRKGAAGISPDWLNEKLGAPEQPSAAFDLLAEKAAFYQVLAAGTKTKKGPNALFHEAPSGTNVAHFRHMRDKQAPLCLACCALGLARLPAFTTSKGAGNFPGINQVPPIYFVPSANTLLYTFMFNWPMAALPHDRPTWDPSGYKVTKREHVSVLEALTWLPRQVRIAKPSGKDTCALCGETDLVCTDIALRKPENRDAERIKQRVLAKGWRDPHVAYIREPQSSKTSKAVHTGSLKASDSLNSPWSAAGEWRQLWRSVIREPVSHGYIGPPSWLRKKQQTSEQDTMIEVQSVGFATDAKAKYFEASSNSIRLAAETLSQPSRRAIVQEELGWLTALIERTLDAKTAQWKQPVKKLWEGTFLKLTARRLDRKRHGLRAALCQIRQQAETVFQNKFLNFLGAIRSSPPAEWKAACNAWRREVEHALGCELRSAVDATMPGSHLRRREAMQRADCAVRKTVWEIKSGGAKPSERPDTAERQDRGRASRRINKPRGTQTKGATT